MKKKKGGGTLPSLKLANRKQIASAALGGTNGLCREGVAEKSARRKLQD